MQSYFITILVLNVPFMGLQIVKLTYSFKEPFCDLIQRKYHCISTDSLGKNMVLLPEYWYRKKILFHFIFISLHTIVFTVSLSTKAFYGVFFSCN